MKKFTLVKEAAEQLNMPVEALISWIEQGAIKTYGQINRDEFIEQLENGEFSDLVAYYNNNHYSHIDDY